MAWSTDVAQPESAVKARAMQNSFFIELKEGEAVVSTSTAGRVEGQETWSPRIKGQNNRKEPQ